MRHKWFENKYEGKVERKNEEIFLVEDGTSVGTSKTLWTDGQGGVCVFCWNEQISLAMGCQALAHIRSDCRLFSHVPFIDIYFLDKWIWLYIILWIDKSTFPSDSSSAVFLHSLLSSLCVCVCWSHKILQSSFESSIEHFVGERAL